MQLKFCSPVKLTFIHQRYVSKSITRLKTKRTTRATLTVTHHTVEWGNNLPATSYSSSPQPQAQFPKFKKRTGKDEIWVPLTYSPSISLLCHCLSTPILIRVMWFYKVAVRSGDEATNRSGCLTSRRIATTHPSAGSLIGGPAECYWIVRKNVISEQHLKQWWWLCHTNACAHTQRHKHVQTSRRQEWEGNGQHMSNSCFEMQLKWTNSAQRNESHVRAKSNTPKQVCLNFGLCYPARADIL